MSVNDDDTGFFFAANGPLERFNARSRAWATATELMESSGAARTVCDKLWTWMLDQQRRRFSYFRDEFSRSRGQGADDDVEAVEFGSHVYMLRIRRAHASNLADPNTPQAYKDGSVWGSVYTDWGSAAHSPWDES